jgi:hypothetical protein
MFMEKHPTFAMRYPELMSGVVSEFEMRQPKRIAHHLLCTYVRWTNTYSMHTAATLQPAILEELRPDLGATHQELRSGS